MLGFGWDHTLHVDVKNSSTMSLGPGIGRSQYGGMQFLFPPRPIPDIWKDARLDFAQTLERRLLAAAAFHSLKRHVTLVSPVPPLADWKHVVGRFGRKFIPIPLSRFSGQTVARLRRFAVLNDRQIRSFAGQFIQG